MVMVRSGLALAILSLLVSTATGIDIPAGTKAPRDRILRMHPAEGERVFVYPLPEAGKPPTPVEVFKGADGSLLWAGGPGYYMIMWFNMNSDDQGQTWVQIVEGNLPNPPGPNPPGPDPPGPDPDPDPPGPVPSNDFEKAVLEALKSIGNPASKSKVAAVYKEIAETANTRRDIWKPALMVDEAKQRVASSLTASELAVWVPFWPKFNDAARALKLDSSDTDAFITMFRDFAAILSK